MYDQLESLRNNFSKIKGLVWFNGIHSRESLFHTHTPDLTLHCFVKSTPQWSSVNGRLIPGLFEQCPPKGVLFHILILSTDNYTFLVVSNCILIYCIT